MLHELGHTSCLTNPLDFTYTGQPSTCQYQGIDNTTYSQYNSVLNYMYQMSMVDYSSGQNDNGGDSNPTAVDHNDWAAIQLGSFTVNGDTYIQGASLSKKKVHDSWLHEHQALKAVSLNKH